MSFESHHFGCVPGFFLNRLELILKEVVILQDHIEKIFDTVQQSK